MREPPAHDLHEAGSLSVSEIDLLETSGLLEALEEENRSLRCNVAQGLKKSHRLSPLERHVSH